MVRVQFPAAAPILYRLRVSTRPSLQNSAYSGQHGGSLPFSFGVVADKQCTCFASRLMWERYPPTPPISTAGNSTNAAPVLKTGSARAEVGALPTPSAIVS